MSGSEVLQLVALLVVTITVLSLVAAFYFGDHRGPFNGDSRWRRRY